MNGLKSKLYNLAAEKGGEFFFKFSKKTSNMKVAINIEIDAFDYLSKIENIKLLPHDKKAIYFLKYLKYCSMELTTFDRLDPKTQNNFTQLIIKFLQTYFSYFDASLKDHIDIKRPEMETLDDILKIVNSQAELSINFNILIYQNQGISILFDYAKIFIDNLINNPYEIIYTYEIIMRVLGTIYNLGRIKHLCSKLWNESNFIDTLFDLAYKIKNNDQFWHLQLMLYGTISFVYEENNLDKYQDIKQIAETISNLIGSCATNLQLNKEIRTKKMFFLMDKEFPIEVRSVTLIDIGWNLIDLFDCLYNLATIDSMKSEIYFQNLLQDYLRIIIYLGNEFEKEYALKLLYQLCFENSIANDVKNNKELYKYIKEMSRYYTSSFNRNNSLKSYEGIIWLIEKKSLIIPELSSFYSVKLRRRIKHVMISYDGKSKDVCLRIKHELNKNQFNTWIDIDNPDPSLESIKKAVEESSCALICMNRYYKKSSNCRLEAEYAIKLNKPIIVLIIEKNYRPDGWLNFLIGSSFIIDFTKHEFLECYNLLISQISLISSNNDETLKIKRDLF